MASGNLSPALLAQIRGTLTTPTLQNAGEGSTSYGPPPAQATIAGRNYIPAGAGFWGFDDVPAFDSGSTVAGYNGRPYDVYDAAGQWAGAGVLSGISNDNLLTTWGPFAMVGAGFAAAIIAGAGAGLAAAGAADSVVANPVTTGAFVTDAGSTALTGGAGLTGTQLLSGAGTLAKVAGTVATLIGATSGGPSAPNPSGDPRVSYTYPQPAPSGSLLTQPGPAGIPLVFWIIGAVALLVELK
jgi:hypothetical protein